MGLGLRLGQVAFRYSPARRALGDVLRQLPGSYFLSCKRHREVETTRFKRRASEPRAVMLLERPLVL